MCRASGDAVFYIITAEVREMNMSDVVELLLVTELYQPSRPGPFLVADRWMLGGCEFTV